MIDDIFDRLGISEDYATIHPRYAEPDDLVEIGPNIVGSLQSLAPDAARAWQALVAAAAKDSFDLLIVSGFRSIAQQARLFVKKLNQGQTIDEILRVNAAPGFSQHHTGRAVDIATPGIRPLTEDFSESAAFQWLESNARQYGFVMPYGPQNDQGFGYEPWHWFYETDNA